MKNFKDMSTVELLSSFAVGQGKTSELPSFTSLEDGQLNYSGLSANVSQAWIESFVLMNLHSNLKDRNPEQQAKLFSAYNDGRLSLNHTVESNSTGNKKPLGGHYLTSEQYYSNMVKLSTNVETVENILSTVKEALLNTKATKDELISALFTIRDSITPPDKLEVFYTLQEKEEKFNLLKEQFASLDVNLTIVSDNSFKVNVKPALMDNTVIEAGKNGYNVEKVDFNPATMSMDIVFKQA
jgi:hypothetical protein